MHSFGSFIRELREKKANLNRKKFGEYFGWHQNSVKGYETLEGRLCDVDYLAVLSYVSGENFSKLVVKRLEAGLDIYPEGQLPRKRKAAIMSTIEGLTGSKAHFVGDPDTIYNMQSPNDFQSNSTDVVSMELADVTMEPTIPKGSKVVAETLFSESLVDGQLYCIKDGELETVRRIRTLGLDGQVRFECDNKVFSAMDFDLTTARRLITGKVVSHTCFY